MTPLLASANAFSWFDLAGLPKETPFDMPAIQVGGTVLQEAGPMPLVPIYHSLLAVLVLVVLAVFARRSLVNQPEGPEALVPEARLSARTFYEMFCEGFLAFLEGILGKEARTYFPLLATLFLYIFTCNVMGVVPGFQITTANLGTNVGMALTVFVLYNIQGIRAHGLWNYTKHMMGPVWWLAPLMLPIELVGHIFRPVSLSMRLMGNMTGDHAVFEIFLHMTYLVIPVIFLFLALFVSLVQALVFTLLSTVYISMAIAHDEEGAH